MPTIYSKFHPYILPTYEKVYRWYEGLDSSDEETSDEDVNSIYFKPEMCFTFYERRTKNY